MLEPVPPLAFDDVVIDLAGHRLWRGGIEQPLEPKAFGVLAMLALSPGRAFSRDEILDAVWGHRHVTPGVLNRVMTLLRHALGEDAHDPRYLHTVHGVGYRFDLPAMAGMTAAVATPSTVDIPTTTADAPASSADGTPRRRATDADSSPKPSPRRWWLAVGVFAVLATGWLVWRRETEPPTTAHRPALAAPPTLVVMPLKPIGDDAGVRTIADGLSEELIGSLARIDGLRVIARESTQLATAESTDPSALAKRLGVSHALEGSLQQSGQALRIRLRLIDAGNGSMLWTRDFDRDASEVLALQRDIAQAVAASLTLRLGLNVEPKKSGDAEYLRRLLAARALAQRTDVPAEASVDQAEIEFRTLVRERPDDARARAGLARALEVRAIRRPELASALRPESLQEARLALRLDARLPDAHMLLASEDCRQERWEACIEGISRIRTMAPGMPDAYLYLAGALSRLGYLDRAEVQYREALRRDPINTDVAFYLARNLDTQGRHEDARILLEETGPRGVYARWFNAMFRRDAGAALRQAEAYDAPGASDSYGRLLKPAAVLTARALADPALWPQAIAEMRQFERDNPGRVSFGLVFAPDAPAHAAEMIAGLAEARRRAYSSYDLLVWTKDLAYLRRDPAFQAYLKDSGILAYWRRHDFPPQCRPHGDGARCE